MIELPYLGEEFFKKRKFLSLKTKRWLSFKHHEIMMMMKTMKTFAAFVK
jgi:hypothetical protein